jgi:hypothetical protein
MGSWRSWLLDSVLLGVLLPPTMMLAGELAESLIHGDDLPPGGPRVLSACALGGGTLGLLLGPVIFLVARVSWRFPLLLMGMGPMMGGLSTWAWMGLMFWMLEAKGPGMSPAKWLLVWGLGAFATGPPWVAYVAVRHRGRPTWPIVLSAVIWGAAASVSMVGWGWLRQNYGSLP